MINIQCSILLKLVPNEQILFVHIIVTVLWHHSLQDIWKCDSIKGVLENHRQGLKKDLLNNLVDHPHWFIIVSMCFVSIKIINNFWYKFLIETKSGKPGSWNILWSIRCGTAVNKWSRFWCKETVKIVCFNFEVWFQLIIDQ